jgi:hypothetical protein
MATTTTNFGWDIPQSTDLVKDGATAIAALGQDIDTALIDLKGGTTGQVLSKASNTDLDYSWVTSDDANAIQNAIVDAKGDLIGATANDTPARLAVGANDTVLVADSGAATGLAWKSSATRYPWTAYTPSISNFTIGNGTLTARYQQIGKTVNVSVVFVLGSTSAISTTPFFSLPVTAAANGLSITGRLTDVGIKDYQGFGLLNTTTVFLFTIGTTATYAGAENLTSTAPFTWATGDFFAFQFSYEAA